MQVVEESERAVACGCLRVKAAAAAAANAVRLVHSCRTLTMH